MKKNFKDRWEKALAFLYQRRDYELERHKFREITEADLTRFKKFLKLTGSPQEKFPSLLIAGTNGKGTVASMIHSIFVQAGYKCGLYTSPHLVDVRERIRLNYKLISRKDFISLIEEIEKWTENYREETGLRTTFEILTALALHYFARKNVDIAILEVGLGGRLDSTNAVDPILSVITSIGYDHQEVLGETLEKITAEKAGIMRKGAPTISGFQKNEVLAVLRKRAMELGSELVLADDHIQLVKVIKPQPGVQKIHIRANFALPEVIIIPFSGRHNIENSFIALSSIALLKRANFAISDEAIIKGMKKVKWKGRLEIINSQKRKIILDGAHNISAAERLKDALGELFPQRDFTYILSHSEERSLDKFLQAIMRGKEKVILVEMKNPRGMKMEMLKQQAMAVLNEEPLVLPFPEAFQKAIEISSENSIIVITGSLYLIGEARSYLKDKKIIKN